MEIILRSFDAVVPITWRPRELGTQGGLLVHCSTLYYYCAVALLLLVLPYITAFICLSSAEKIKHETISNSRETLKRCKQRPCPFPGAPQPYGAPKRPVIWINLPIVLINSGPLKHSVGLLPVSAVIEPDIRQHPV